LVESANLKDALVLCLKDESFEKPAETETPMVTMVKVAVRGFTCKLN